MSFADYLTVEDLVDVAAGVLHELLFEMRERSPPLPVGRRVPFLAKTPTRPWRTRRLR